MLRGELDPRDYARVETRYRALSKGDKLTFTYLPTNGTSLLVDGQPLLRQRGSALMRAVLDELLDDSPVAEALRSDWSRQAL